MKNEIKGLGEIDCIEVETFKAAIETIACEKEKWNPRSRETADHSLPYCVAVALHDDKVGLEQFEKEKLIFRWYNHQHHHSGLGYLTPYEVHYGLAEKRREQRAGVLKEAFEKNPERFVRGPPQPALLPTAAWINKPKEISSTDSAKGVNLSMDDIEQKNGFRICPITNDQPSGKGMIRA